MRRAARPVDRASATLCYGRARMEPLREIGVILRCELVRSLRGGRTLGLLLLYVIGAALSSLVVVGFASTGAIEAGPALLAFFPRFALFFMPLLVAVVGFDQIAGELQHRSLRYVAMRAHRGSIVLGKALALAVVIFALTALVHLAMFAYAALTTPALERGDALAGMLLFWLSAVSYSLCYIGLSSLCSSLVRAPMAALIGTLTAIAGFWFVDVVGRFSRTLAPLALASPSHYTDGLLGAPLSELATSVVAYVAFTLIFLGLSWAVLRTRDL